MSKQRMYHAKVHRNEGNGLRILLSSYIVLAETPSNAEDIIREYRSSKGFGGEIEVDEFSSVLVEMKAAPQMFCVGEWER